MQTLVWAFGTTLVLMLIISFLPLGFTKKGKIFVVFCGFVLAEAGLAVRELFSLWQIALMLVVLIFLVAYIIHNKFGTFLYKEIPSLEDEFINDAESSHLEEEVNSEKNDHLLVFSKTEKPAASNERQSFASILKKSQSFEQSEAKQDEEHLLEIMDEEIVFLDDRNVHSDIIEQRNSPELSSVDLSEIETMLIEVEENKEVTNNDWLTDLNDLQPETFEEIRSDIILTSKEVAAGKEDEGKK